MATGNIHLRVVCTTPAAAMLRDMADAIPSPTLRIGMEWSVHPDCATLHLAPRFDPGDPTDALTVARLSPVVDEPVDGGW